LYGTVKNANSGSAVNNVSVTVSDTEVFSNTQGKYQYLALDDGQHTLVATKIGYEPFSSSLTIAKDTPLAYDITLSPEESDGINNGLAVHFTFTGDATDVSGNGNHGEVNGATLVAGRDGSQNGAYSFDGVDDYISFSPSLDGDVSISLFIKPRTLENDSRPINNIDGPSRPAFGFRIFDNRLQIWANAWGYISSTQLQVDEWAHLVIVTSGKSAKLYLNGEEESSLTQTVDFTYTTLAIGAKFQFFYGKYFDGIVDDVRVYNRAISSSEVSSIYNN